MSHITTLDSPGDQSQSMGFSVLWDASNTQPHAGAANALTPDGKRPVSKATEKRRQRLAEEQEQRRQEEEKRVLQQRRQQTIKEIRQRQAAAATQAGATSQSAPTLTAQPGSSTSAGSSRLDTSLDDAGQGRGRSEAASRNGPQQSRQRAELKGNGRTGPQQITKHAGLRAESQQGTGVFAEGHGRAGSRPPSRQPDFQKATGSRAGQRTNQQQSAEPSTDRQGSVLRAAAPPGHRQSTGQFAGQQQQVRTVVTAAQTSKCSVRSRPSSSRSGQGAAEQKVTQQRPDLQGASTQQQQQASPLRGGQSGKQADSLEAGVQLRMNSSLSPEEAERAQNEASKSRPGCSNAPGKQSLQQLRRLSLARSG